MNDHLNVGDARIRLRTLLAERSFRLGSFVLASGQPSPYYVDARRTTLHPEGMVLTGLLGLELVRKHAPETEAVGGLTMGADPIAYAIAHRSWLEGRPIEAFTVRKETKSHGGGRRVEGAVEAGTRVVVVEDTLTTGGSALKAVEALREVDARVQAVVTLVDREEGGRDRLAEAGVTVHALFTAAELAKEIESDRAAQAGHRLPPA